MSGSFARPVGVAGSGLRPPVTEVRISVRGVSKEAAKIATKAVTALAPPPRAHGLLVWLAPPPRSFAAGTTLTQLLRG